MRIFSVLTAILVGVVLYLWVMERDLLMRVATGEAPAQDPARAAAPAPGASDAAPGAASGGASGAALAAEPPRQTAVPVVVVRSSARTVAQAVVARGHTEAARIVEVRAETSGRIVSEPLRKGRVVARDEVLCRIDSGTREIALSDAKARLAEALARVPAAEAALTEAESRVPAAEAAIREAEARVPAAEAALTEAESRVPVAEAALREAESRVPAAEAALREAESRVPAAEAALAEAESRVPAAEAALAEAESRVPAAEAALREAESRVPAAEAALRQARAQLPLMEARRVEAEARLAEARTNYDNAVKLSEQGYAPDTQVTAARAVLESAVAGVEAVRSQLEGARAGVEQARAQLAGAHAAVEQARSQVAGARAAVVSARSQVQTARAAVEQARTQVAAAEAGVAAARSQIETARTGVAQARAQVENAAAGVVSARAALQGARAAVESARSQLEGARAGVETARAQVESARAAIETARAGVASAENELARIVIRAPFAGLLETDTAELGSLLQPGSLCATVIRLDPIRLVGFIPETQVDAVRVGAPARARLSTGREVAGAVSFLARAADPTTRTFRVEVEVPNPEGAIRDGQSAEIAIEARPRVGHFLPQSALTLDDSGTLGVRVVETGPEGTRARFLPVEILEDSREGVWLAGLPAEADVIVIGQEFVTDGVEVAPSYREHGQ